MNRKILALCLAAFALLSGIIPVSAEEFDPAKTGSISVTLTEQQEKAPIVGAELNIYHIATASCNPDGTLLYNYTPDFAETGIALNSPDLAAQLDAYLAEHDAPATAVRTDAAGSAFCRDLPLGLYFIRQTNQVAGFAPCIPFLVTIPMVNEEGYTYDVNASPKTEVAKLTAITIRKVWNTDGSSQAASSVTIQLLRNGIVVHTATLSQHNNWQITYTDMPESDGYSVQEVDVPKGFTATYKQNGYVFTVTNTATLAQTGQLIWPIPVLALAGILLIALGSAVLQKKRAHNA